MSQIRINRESGMVQHYSRILVTAEPAGSVVPAGDGAGNVYVCQVASDITLKTSTLSDVELHGGFGRPVVVRNATASTANVTIVHADPSADPGGAGTVPFLHPYTQRDLVLRPGQSAHYQCKDGGLHRFTADLPTHGQYDNFLADPETDYMDTGMRLSVPITPVWSHIQIHATATEWDSVGAFANDGGAIITLSAMVREWPAATISIEAAPDQMIHAHAITGTPRIQLAATGSNGSDQIQVDVKRSNATHEYRWSIVGQVTSPPELP